MYHYVRNKDKNYPYYNVLAINKFKQQVKKFKKNGLVNSYEELFTDNNKYLLTFDDGFKDHIQAAEILKKSSGIGIFFIPTSPLQNNIILDVHKAHLILGKINALDVMQELKSYLNKNNLTKYYNESEKIKYKTAYSQFDDLFYRKQFKKIINYYGNFYLKEKILNYLMKKFEINIKAKDYYLNKKEIKYISSLGMVIGSHSENHILLSRLSYLKQYKEIKNSKIFLENLINKNIEVFCYPYGGKTSYNLNTIKILKKLKFKLAYSVKNKNITSSDIKNNPLELPRFDCNIF